MARPARPKRLNYDLIREREEPAMYALLAELVAAHHPDLSEATIALAWRKGLKKDPDGRLILGKCKKATDLDRELHKWDFVVLLNKEVWTGDFNDAQKRALIDHELCHASVTKTRMGEIKRDEKDRPVYRIRKHDLEEFREIVERHGLYKADLEAFAEACAAKRETPLFASVPEPEGNGHAEEAESKPGRRRKAKAG